MRQKISKNEKGAVLLTVICFTTMCMLIVAMALRFASQSNMESTNNVMRAQAQVTAEHYLQQYLSTFPMATGSDGNARVNYDQLKTIAGASKSTPTRVTIAIQPNDASTSSVNISADPLKTTALYGGNCTILIYKEGANGIVVRAEANYNAQSGVASAYFYGEKPSADLNKNALEVCGNYVVENGANVRGDVLVDADPNGLIRFNNSNGTGYYSNYNTNGNLSQHNNDVRFNDTIFENAPTITVGGHLYVWQLKITTTVGKTDVNGNTRTRTSTPGTTYDPNNLLNKNGYINVFHKFIMRVNPAGMQIGDSTNDIDVYSCGMIVGGIPQVAYGPYDQTRAKGFHDKIVAMGEPDNSDGGGEIWGNVYCFVGDSDGIEDDGDFIKNSQNDVTIHGDLCVEGDIRVMKGRLVVEGNLVCKGQIVCTNGVTLVNNGTTYNATHTITNTWPSTPRSERPPKNYAPGLYVFGENDTPEINSPKNYRALSTNVMYADGTDKSKNFKQNFAEALKYGLGDSYGTTRICPEYTNENIANKELTITRSCVLTEAEAGVGSSGGNDGAKYTVKVTNQDIWILLPAKTSGAESVISARFLVENPQNEHHCYFAFYNPAGVTINNGKVDVASINETKAAYFYLFDTYNDTNRPKIFMNPNIHGEVAMGTKAFAKNSWNSKRNGSDESQLDRTAATNIVMLIPDGVYFKLGYNGWYGCYNAVFYGPKSEFVLRQNEGNRVYGQIKVDKYTIDEAEQEVQSVQYDELEQGSILHSWLTQGSSATGTLNMQYYIKAK